MPTTTYVATYVVVASNTFAFFVIGERAARKERSSVAILPATRSECPAISAIRSSLHSTSAKTPPAAVRREEEGMVGCERGE